MNNSTVPNANASLNGSTTEAPHPDIEIYKSLHASCQIICWMVCVPNAIFISRYWKETCTGIVICDRKFWFFMHVALMMTGFLLSLVGVNSILTGRAQLDHRWPTTKCGIHHAKIGVSAMLFFLFQIIFGWYRPVSHGVRRSFSIFHSLIGHVAYVLAVWNIAESYTVGMPCYVLWVVLAALLWLGLCHGIMIYHFVWLDRNMGLKRYRALKIFPIKVLLFEDAPGAKQRKRIFFICLTGCIFFATLLILMFVAFPDFYCGDYCYPKVKRGIF